MKKILITGCGSGLGKLMAIELAKAGHQVIASVHSQKSVDNLNKVAKENNIKLMVEILDITSNEDREKAVNWDIDVLINNAGIGETGPLAEIPMEYFIRNFEVNVFATLSLTQNIVKKMVENKVKGEIIFISSVAGLITKAYTGPYCATKHAIEAIAETLSEELKDYGINISVVNPGPYNTGFNDAHMLEMNKWYDFNKNFTKLKEDDFKFPFEQYDPKELIDHIVKMVNGEVNLFRNLLPESFVGIVKEYQQDIWNKKK